MYMKSIYRSVSNIVYEVDLNLKGSSFEDRSLQTYGKVLSLQIRSVKKDKVSL